MARKVFSCGNNARLKKMFEFINKEEPIKNPKILDSLYDSRNEYRMR